MMEEPSVWDYLVAKLSPWRRDVPEIPLVEQVTEQADEADSQDRSEPSTVSSTDVSQGLALPQANIETDSRSVGSRSAPLTVHSFPWAGFLALGFAMTAQLLFEPGLGRTVFPGNILYLLSMSALVYSQLRGQFSLSRPESVSFREDSFRVRTGSLVLASVLSIAAVITLGGNRFTTLNVFLWLSAVAAFVAAFWSPQSPPEFGAWMRNFRSGTLQIQISPWTLLLLGTWVLVIFFRIYRLGEVPPEMVSDQAEKLLDVWDVLHGETRIFFPRNTGREALQMYLTAGIIRLFGTGYSFLSLKIGTVAAGILTLPYVYLLGKDIGGRRVAWLALFLAGVAYWPNVISRVGLRFPFYPLFVAPVLYYLLRGLRCGDPNQFILTGLFMGAGLHGYTPIRILPVVVVLAVVLFIIHPQARSKRIRAVNGLLIVALISLIVFLPLGRFALENPDIFLFRSISRFGSIERNIPGNPIVIFLSNLWNAMTMFAWDDGEIWVTSVPGRPALDFISAALFYLGMTALMVRYLRRRFWIDLFLLLAVPFLLMPSILSLAFPAENPSLNRMGGAIVPVFIISALALDGLLSTIERWWPKRKLLIWGGLSVLLLLISAQNFELVFNRYRQIYENSSWNTSEMGAVIQSFANSVGNPDTAWVMAYPHWVDTRLVGINAGYTLRDYAITTDRLDETRADRRTKLFLVKPDDTEGLRSLQTVYPDGLLKLYESKVENHDFYMYFVPSDDL